MKRFLKYTLIWGAVMLALMGCIFLFIKMLEFLFILIGAVGLFIIGFALLAAGFGFITWLVTQED